jgi:hypothetical protein
MAEVVVRSTQYLTDEDLRSLAVFLKNLSQASAERATSNGPTTEYVHA